MSLRNRLSHLEKMVAGIKLQQENTVPVPIGVHYLDENGDTLPDSGPVTRASKDCRNAFGVLAVSAPIDRSQWGGVMERVKDYQDRLARGEMPPEAKKFLEMCGDGKRATSDCETPRLRPKE